MMFVRILPAAAAAACFCAPSMAQGPEFGARCDPGQPGCEANVAGDENQLLQVKIRDHEVMNQSNYVFSQGQALALAPLAKLAYCGGTPGTAKSAEKSCGSKGYCKEAGVKIKKGSVHTMSLTDEDSPNAVVAFTAHYEPMPGGSGKHPLKPGCVAAIRGTWPGTNNEERGKEQDMVPLDAGARTRCKDCRAHEGYQKIWKVLKPGLLGALKKSGCHKSTPLYLTGHSMGGAVATLGMLEMKLDGWNVQHSYVFHNPRTGDAAFVKYFNKVLTGSEDGAAVTRVTHALDNIPTWPWNQRPDGSYYAYTWPEVHYHQVGEKYVYSVCKQESTDCGVLSEEKLCSQKECDDHLVDPLAPASNFCIPKDPIGSCMLGKGNVAAEDARDLPSAARHHKPAAQQFGWMSSQLRHAF